MKRRENYEVHEATNRNVFVFFVVVTIATMFVLSLTEQLS